MVSVWVLENLMVELMDFMDKAANQRLKKVQKDHKWLKQELTKHFNKRQQLSDQELERFVDFIQTQKIHGHPEQLKLINANWLNRNLQRNYQKNYWFIGKAPKGFTFGAKLKKGTLRVWLLKRGKPQAKIAELYTRDEVLVLHRLLSQGN